MNSRPRLLSRVAALLLPLVASAGAAVDDLLFTVRIDGSQSTNIPTIYVTNNSPNLDISSLRLSIGDTSKHFDQGDSRIVDGPPGGGAVMVVPGGRNDVLDIGLSDFNPGETFSFRADVDNDPDQNSGEDYRLAFFNQNDPSKNAVVTVRYGAATASARLVPIEPGDPRRYQDYTFRGPTRTLTVTSRAEEGPDGAGDVVQGVTVLREGVEIASGISSGTFDVGHGDRVQIRAPQAVYKDIHSQYLTIDNESENNPDSVESAAHERFVAIGMSVNDVAQTADPTYYDFEARGNTEVQVKWRHFYALIIKQDFSGTASRELVAGKPWAGPLTSDATGAPDPPVSKQWVQKGEQPTVTIDGDYIDPFSHPGLDIRYVVKGFRAYGPPNSFLSEDDNEVRFGDKGKVDISSPANGTVSSYAAGAAGFTVVTSESAHGLEAGDRIELRGSGTAAYNGVHEITAATATTFTVALEFLENPNAKGTWKDVTYERMIEFPGVAPRQQLKPAFDMYGPGGITYVWQIQYGVRVATDDPARGSLAKVYQVTVEKDDAASSGGDVVLVEKDEDVTVQDGVAWFDPGAKVKVVAAGEVPGEEGLALTGWANGDGYYFANQGEVDPTTGEASSGEPAEVNGSPVANWITDGPGGTVGYEIGMLRRPVRVLWRYGAGAIVVDVVIGQHLFENYPQYAPMFTRQPEPIINAQPDPAAVDGSGTAPGADLMAEWDPVSGRLYPTIPGRFTVPWKPGTDSDNAVEVRVVARLPFDPERRIRGHYPHLQGAPAVAVDPDPGDDVSFKSVKYSTAGGTVDGNGLFTTENPGLTVLLFSEIQRIGRGEPREFLMVRVVDTRPWNERLPAQPSPVEVGRRILDPDVDLARLGTGYLFDPDPTIPSRHNPFVYDASLVEGLAARDIYDMDRLRADDSGLVVVNKAALPGPVIPVNEHPGVTDDELPIVMWYDDPRRNDGLMWPYLSRIYRPRWPDPETVPQIVIASQFGSEGLGPDEEEQPTAPATGEFPEATTYDPSRLQSVQIYNQPDPESPGYNPNEEHALMAPSLRFASVSPRPPAAFALRAGDLNRTNRTITSGDSAYTSHPFVLVQFYDVADDEMKMNLYRVKRESALGDSPSYTFARDFTPNVTSLASQAHVTMEAGEPVIPFYPLGVAIGASPAPETFGNNLFPQEAYWEDWKGSYWSISGGPEAWFEVSFYYPLAPDFWWPPNLRVPGVEVVKNGSTYTATYVEGGDILPQVGDSVAFLPAYVTDDPKSQFDSHLPTPLLYKSDWPENAPVLKAGETLTFSGGEFAADQIFRGAADPAPGLPQLTAFASAEVVFDSLNPEGRPADLTRRWTARVVQALEKRTVSLSTGDFPSELQPASGRVRVSQGKYIFNELPASLQKRLRYDPLAVRIVNGSEVSGVLEFSGLLNDKDIGDPTLTASPPAVYVLEPNILTGAELEELLGLVSAEPDRTVWQNAVRALYDATRNPEGLPGGGYQAGLMRLPLYNDDGSIAKDSLGNVLYPGTVTPAPFRAYGPGLALVPNGDFLDPTRDDYPDVSWVTVVENNDPALGGSPITPHIIKVDRRERYRGAIKTILSDNVFDENIVLRSTGDFGANADDLYFEWWYRPDDGSLDVPPPDLIPSGQTSPWKVFPDPSGDRGKGRYQITLKGNPNAPEALLADTWWFCRYRHANDNNSGTDWSDVNFIWAGAGNSQPFVDADLDGFPDFRAQLAQGWIKRVLDAVNPYEARIRDFEGDSPSTVASMIAQFGARYEGPVALNPDKNVIENVGLIELYETILNRGRSLSIDLSRPVSTPAIANALQLASTRIADFYTLLGNEAYVDALDPTIGHGSNSAAYGSLSSSVFTFQNQLPSMISEELALLRGVDDFFARPVYNRLFWNFTKGEGEAAYATNYNLHDGNADGFIDEADAMLAFPQGHGDAWGHYLTAVRNQYELLRHPFFNWVSRSESYNLQDIVLKVDFLDERKFAATAAQKAKAGAEIVSLSYRERYVAEPEAQWQGYTDSNPDRAWGVDEWARRGGQGAYFDWVTANALLPSEHPNGELEGIQKVDRRGNGDIPVISANLNAIQRTLDQADQGYNPLGLAGDAQMFDLDPSFLDYGSGVQGQMHFDQIYERAMAAIDNAVASWDNANQRGQLLRQVGNSEAEFKNATFQEDLAYRNRLIQIFGKPYEGTIGSGKLYPPGYEGPDLALYMYVPVREITADTVPGPTTGFATFNGSGTLTGGDLYNAFVKSNPDGSGNSIYFENELDEVGNGLRTLFSPTFAGASNDAARTSLASSGLFDVEYTDLDSPRVDLENLAELMPVTAAGYTFQAPPAWGGRGATGELQDVINQMIRQEAEVARAIAAWDGQTGETIRILRLLNARLDTSGLNQGRDEVFSRVKLAVNDIIKVIETAKEINDLIGQVAVTSLDGVKSAVPDILPTGGLAVSPGDALSFAEAGAEFGKISAKTVFKSTDTALKIGKLVAEISLDIAENELNLAKARDERKLQIREWLKELEDQVGDEAILRIAVFKEIQALEALSNRYRTLLDEGGRLVDERAAFNKRVAAQTQLKRYQDMTFRVSRNHALSSYRNAFDLASRYAYLAVSAYDYETNYDFGDAGSPAGTYGQVISARTAGSLRGILSRLKANYDSQGSQLGFNNVQRETGEISLRRELMRILPSGEVQPDAPANEFPAPGRDADTVWREALQDARVSDLWQLSEFREHCRPFAAATDASGRPVPQPGIVLRFPSDISSGRNFFGKPLSGGDQAYSTSNYATKILGAGVAFSGYRTDDILNDLSAAPRIYFIPAGLDVMRVSRSEDPDALRMWKVVEQAIPVPYPAGGAQLDQSGYIPLLDNLNGRIGDARRFSDFRAYPNQLGEAVTDSRLVGRSVWNTEWLLIIPGATLNADPETGLDRFVDQVTDIKLIFDTYGQSGG